MPEVNQWNEFGSKLAQGLGLLGTSIAEKKMEDNAKDTYTEAMKNIRDIMNSARQEFTVTPKEDSIKPEEQKSEDYLTNFFTGFTPEAGIEENIKTMQPVTTGPETGEIAPRVNQNVLKTAEETTVTPENVFDIYMRGMSELANNPFGQQYEPLLTAYYNAQQPKQEKYEYREVGGELVRIGPDGKVQPVYGNKKQEYTYDVPNDYRIIEEEGKYYFEFPRLDKTGSKLEFIRSGEATEDEYLAYQNRMDIAKEKFSDLDKQGFKLGKKLGSLKTPEIPPTGQEKALLEQINEYNKLKDIPWDKLTGQDQAKYKYLNEQITQKTGLDADEVAVDIATERFKKKNKEFNIVESINERRDIVKSQQEEVNNLWLQLDEMIRSGQATQEQAREAVIKWYNENKEQLIPEIRRWVEDSLKNMGVI